MQFARASLEISVYLFLIVASISFIPQARAQSEIFVFGGEVCQTKNPAVKDIRRVSGVLMNISESNRLSVSCPIFSKTQIFDGLESSSVDLEVNIYFSNLNSIEQKFRCVFSELVFTGISHVRERKVAYLPGDSGSGIGSPGSIR